MNKLLFRSQVMSDSSWPHGLQNARLPYPSPSPEVYPSSYPFNWWCHPTISSSVTFLHFCLQFFLASGSFPMSWLFTSGGQHIGASASASVLPMNIQGWFPLGLIDWFDLFVVQGSQESSPAPQLKASILQQSAFFIIQLLHPYMTTGKTIALTRQTFVKKVMSLLLIH